MNMSPVIRRDKSPRERRYKSPVSKRHIRPIIGVDNSPRRYRDIAPVIRKPRDKDIGEIKRAPSKLSRYPLEGQLIPTLPPPWSEGSSHTAGSKLSETSDSRYPVFSSSSSVSGTRTAGVDTGAGELVIPWRKKGAKGRTWRRRIPAAERGDKSSGLLAEVVNGRNGDDKKKDRGQLIIGGKDDTENMGADNGVEYGADIEHMRNKNGELQRCGVHSNARSKSQLGRVRPATARPQRSQIQENRGQRYEENRGFDDKNGGSGDTKDKGSDDIENRGSGDNENKKGADIEFVGFFGITGSKVPIRRSVATHCSLSDTERSPGSEEKKRGKSIWEIGARIGDMVGRAIFNIGDQVSATGDTEKLGRENTGASRAYDVHFIKRRGYPGTDDTIDERVSIDDTEENTGEDTMSGKVVVSKPAPSRGLNASTSDTAMGVLQGEETEVINLGSMGPSNVPTSAEDGCYTVDMRKSPQASRTPEIQTDGRGIPNSPGLVVAPSWRG